jgi:predicted S18 family serine protease
VGISLLVLMLVVSLAACGSPSKATTTTTGAAVTTSTVASTSTTEIATTTTVADRFPAKVSAKGLAYATDSSGQPKGATISFTVEINRNPDKKVSVGVREGEVSGTGDQWRAAAWAAPLAAASMLNVNLADYTVDYDVDGRVDGPSAGGLMTIATIAAFMGDTLKTDVTMTGTINPDYTIGPVGGIPQKLEGAAAAGMKTVLVPLGQRYDYDEKTGDLVDLVQKGTQLGLTVKEVADVYEAYPYFTGNQLPKPQGSGSGTPALGSASEQTLKDCIQNDAAAANQLLTERKTLAAAYLKYGAANATNAAADISQADNQMVQGSFGAAYGSVQDAAREAFKAYLYAKASSYSDWQKLALWLKGQVPTTSISQVQTQLVARSPKTVGEASCVMDAWGCLAQAQADAQVANNDLDEISSNYDTLSNTELDNYMTEAIDYYSEALLGVQCAQDDLKLADVATGPAITSTDMVAQLAESYRRAGEANVAMLDSVVVPEDASAWGVSEADAKNLLAAYDPNYFQAVQASNQIQTLLGSLPEGTARDYAVLGISFDSFTSSAASIAENYDYIAKYDKNGNITGFTFDKPLSNALDLAKTNAGNGLLQLDSTGDGTVIPWTWYDMANSTRDSAQPADKIASLYYYWNATAQTRALLAISGGAQSLVQQ